MPSQVAFRGQVFWPALPGFLWEMSNGSDTGERKGHKRKLADALTPPAGCSEASTSGDPESILSQVGKRCSPLIITLLAF